MTEPTTTSEGATPFRFNLAPERLWQAINPMTFLTEGSQFGLINISLGETRHPEVERAVLAEVGSYGRQLGHIGDALEVLMDQVDPAALTLGQSPCLSRPQAPYRGYRALSSL
jgi:hypothetical protein